MPSQTSALPSRTSESYSSLGWIAGAVIGPVAGVVMIVGLLWFMFQRKQKQAVQAALLQAQPYTDYARATYRDPQELDVSNP